MTVKLPGAIHRDLVAYAKCSLAKRVIAVSDPVKLIVPMLAKFMATDRTFAKSKKSAHAAKGMG